MDEYTARDYTARDALIDEIEAAREAGECVCPIDPTQAVAWCPVCGDDDYRVPGY